tara:strand:+ start:2644 stop:2928 length:285 start_codon:yes stop_codon:yes gene_type:complete
MCIGGGGGAPAPAPKPRWLQDTDKEVIVSKYELSDENKERNRQRRLASVSKRRVLLDDGGEGSGISGGGNDGGLGGGGIGGNDPSNDASGGQTV